MTKTKQKATVEEFMKELGSDHLAARMANAISKDMKCFSLNELREHRKEIGDTAFTWEVLDVPGLGPKGRERLGGLL